MEKKLVLWISPLRGSWFIPAERHYHYFEGHTTVNGSIPHTHRYGGNTGNEV